MRIWAIPVILASTTLAQAAPADRDRRMDGYLAIWAQNAEITPATVTQLYAGSVDYYGRRMSNSAVFRDKLAFVRHWPERRYEVVPDTVSNDCTPNAAACRVTAVVRWQRADAAGRRGQRGTNTIKLDLIRDSGVLKIARESGVPLR